MKKQANRLNELVKDKLNDVQIPGFIVEFSPTEADLAGAFREDALSEEDAFESQFDNDALLCEE